MFYLLDDHQDLGWSLVFGSVELAQKLGNDVQRVACGGDIHRGAIMIDVHGALFGVGDVLDPQPDRYSSTRLGFCSRENRTLRYVLQDT